MLGRVIQSFGDADTQRVWRRERVRRFGSDLQRMANRKLLIIDAAETLNDLRVPPGNRLERLRGERVGSTASESMISGGSALSGLLRGLPTSKLLIITERGRN
jgi:plasmid maintenance system killer protein